MAILGAFGKAFERETIRISDRRPACGSSSHYDRLRARVFVGHFVEALRRSVLSRIGFLTERPTKSADKGVIVAIMRTAEPVANPWLRARGSML